MKLPRIATTTVVFAMCMLTPFFVYNQLFNVLDKESRSWFIYHPFLMTAAAIGLPLAAVLQQRLFGYYSNKLHMHMMIIAFSLAAAGAYVIISIKQGRNESHFETVHAMLGLGWLLGSATQASLGMLGLDRDNRIKFFRPDQGVANRERFVIVRRLHTITGRGILCLGYAAAMMGWQKFFGVGSAKWWSMLGFLSGLATIALVDPIRDFFEYTKTQGLFSRAARGA